MTTLPFHNIVSMWGYTNDDFIHTVNLGLAADGTAMAKTDEGSAMTFDSTGPNKMRLATEGDPINALLKVVEIRPTGAMASVAFRFISKFSIEANDPAAIGDTVVGAAGGSEASGLFTQTSTNNFLNTDTVAVGGKTYTFQTSLTNVANNVALGATFALSVANLVAAIMAGAGSGTAYAAATTANANVTASAPTASTLAISAILGGTAGNAITTVYTASGTAAGAFGAATLSGGNVVVSNRGGWVKKATSNDSTKNVIVEKGIDPVTGLTYVVVVRQ